ncbi:MAG TPA: ABC transporter permease [Candidatus Limnocylindrales bacterium]
MTGTVGAPGRLTATRPRAVVRRAGGGGGTGAIAAAWALGMVFALPVAVLLVRAVGGGSILRALGNPAVTDALVLSLVTTACSLVLTIAIGLPLALVLARRLFRGKWLLETIVDLPIVLPPSVAGLALLLLLGRRGLLGAPLQALGITIPFTVLAVVVAQVFVSAPFFIRSARAGFASVNRDLEDAARVDGARERDLFRRVTVPLAAPALAAGLVMAWARALGEFGATIMFAGSVAGRTQTLPLLVYGEFGGGDLDAAIAAAAVLVLAAGGVLVAVRGLHWGRALDTGAA